MSFFRGKRVLVTGHTGFKGSWLCAWLCELGAEVTGLSLPAAEDAPLFGQLGLAQRIAHHEGDIRHPDLVRDVFAKAAPEIVFHLAAQALVLRSYDDPIETFGTNVMGSVNVLDACRQTPGIRALVYITSDKCYENREWLWGYRETDRLGGHDPYSASKGCAEIVFNSYRHSFPVSGLAAASVRAGNVVGGGDWSANRLVPDCIRALRAGRPIEVRNPASRRPWQHVLEPLGVYLEIGRRLVTDGDLFAGSWNVGPQLESNRPAIDVVNAVVEAWGGGKVTLSGHAPARHEARLLFLNCDKAHQELGWSPSWDFGQTVGMTVDWYKRVEGGAVPMEVTARQIRDYSDVAFSKLGFLR
jgi:CDP-glucose 4,6-dehydratase